MRDLQKQVMSIVHFFQGIGLLNFFRIFVWFIFIAIVVYVILSWIYEEKVSKKRDVIRKTWYTILLLGGIIYWSCNPNSIFTDWKKYLIVAIVFALVDAFIFLGMYLRKVGNHELAIATKQVEATETIVLENREKVKNLTRLLKEQGIPMYYNTKEEYISLLGILLEEYANQQGLELEIVRFATDVEQEQALDGYKYINKATVRTKLVREETYYKEKLAFHPVVLLSELYLIKVTSKEDISDIDISMIGLLILTFDLVIKEN